MGQREAFTPEKLICGILYSADINVDSILESLVTEFGTIEYRSGMYPFTFTDYYEKEMGAGLQKVFVSFSPLIDPQTLPEIKIRTNRLEQEYAHNGYRTVNLDPGLLNLYRLVLATTKNAPHRIPLSEGIYGEVTLLYRSGEYRELPWTYPDFRTKSYKTILTEIRSMYKRQLKQQG